jgi:phthalate 4,5-dioxygenase oxygenase subunit
MLTDADNALITRIGPGTPAGALLRRYWFPLAQSATLVAGDAPRRVRLLSENYVAFRATDGRVAVVAEGCPHRGASLALARNENCALQCLFHGWKIGVEGTVIDVPSEPPEHAAAFAAKVRVRALAVREAGGLVWAFAGAGEPSPFPAFEFTALPDDRIIILPVRSHANWVQMTEGQLDSSHVSHLHASSNVTQQLTDLIVVDGAPVYDVRLTTYGLQAAAERRSNGSSYTRVTEFIMPSWTFIPPAARPGTPEYDGATAMIICQMPVDDEHTISWYVLYNRDGPIDRTADRGARYPGWHAALAAHDAADQWGQDRDKMRAGHQTGLPNLLAEDVAISESMGPIADRSREYLGSSDAAITRFRRVMIEAIRAHERGEIARGLDPGIDFNAIRSAGIMR